MCVRKVTMHDISHIFPPPVDDARRIHPSKSRGSVKPPLITHGGIMEALMLHWKKYASFKRLTNPSTDSDLHFFLEKVKCIASKSCPWKVTRNITLHFITQAWSLPKCFLPCYALCILCIKESLFLVPISTPFRPPILKCVLYEAARVCLTEMRPLEFIWNKLQHAPLHRTELSNRLFLFGDVLHSHYCFKRIFKWSCVNIAWSRVQAFCLTSSVMFYTKDVCYLQSSFNTHVYTHINWSFTM